MAGGGERISGGETARGWGSTCSYWARLSTRPTSVACVKCGVGRALAMRPGSWSELFGDQEFRKQIYHRRNRNHAFQGRVGLDERQPSGKAGQQDGARAHTANNIQLNRQISDCGRAGEVC